MTGPRNASGWVGRSARNPRGETDVSDPSVLKKESLEAVSAAQGAGPLLERDYSAVIEATASTPEDLGALLRERFPEFGPPETAIFDREGRAAAPLDVGDELSIRIALLGPCRVRVVCADPRSLTLRTLKGHPEAGRITFGAGRDDRGRLTFRILSRARASGLLNYLGFFVLGKQMQARCWIRFIDRLAAASGGRVAGKIRVTTRRVEPSPADGPGGDDPTFTGTGGD